jgi:hypothetical protein
MEVEWGKMGDFSQSAKIKRLFEVPVNVFKDSMHPPLILGAVVARSVDWMVVGTHGYFHWGLRRAILAVNGSCEPQQLVAAQVQDVQLARLRPRDDAAR